MKVLIIHNILWSHYKAKVFSELHKILSNKDIELFVIQVAATEKIRKNLGLPDKSLHNYPYKLLYDNNFEETTIGFRLKNYFNWIQKNNPNIIILPGYFDKAIWLIMVYARLKGIKIIQTVDSNLYDRDRVWWKEFFKSKLLSLSSLIYCYGTMQIEYLKSLKIPENKIHIRMQATDNGKIIDEYNYILKKHIPFKNYFLYVGRLSKEKNLWTLINAFEELVTDYGLIIVGDGDMKSHLESYVEKKSLHNVIFTGGISWRQTTMYYKFSDVFILPSISEPWGLVANEAMLCKLPVVISSHCGCSKDLVKEGINGYIFNPTKTSELVDIMKRFTNMKTAQLNKMGEESYKIIKKYTPENSAQQMYEGIKKVCKI